MHPNPTECVKCERGRIKVLVAAFEQSFASNYVDGGRSSWMWCWGYAWMSGAGTGDTMVLPGWIGNQGDVVEGGRSAEALVWE